MYKTMTEEENEIVKAKALERTVADLLAQIETQSSIIQNYFEKVVELDAQILELERLISDRPRNLTTLPPEFQRLWEALIRISDKAEFKFIVRHMMNTEERIMRLEAVRSAAQNLCDSIHPINFERLRPLLAGYELDYPPKEESKT